MTKSEPNRGAAKWMAIITSILSVAALLVSLTSYYNAEVRRAKDVPYEVIPKTYDKYYEMNKIELDKPYLTHLFVTPERYPEIKRMAKESVGVISKQQRAGYQLEERAVADFVFSYYEQTLYQWDATKDKERQFTQGVLDYLQGRLLRNPRLVYWWREQNGGLETSYEDHTRADWKSKVLKGINQSNPGWCDPSGPFGDPSLADAKC